MADPHCLDYFRKSRDFKEGIFSSKAEIEDAALSMLYPFRNLHIVYRHWPKSAYDPSCHMMDYLVHQINGALVDNLSFKIAAPSYHPYIIRLYFGVLFWIQCLCAAFDVSALDCEQHQFLTDFLSCHPLETLAVPGPLMPLFKTLCASQPEYPTYEKVYPRLPAIPGPERRSQFLKRSTESHFLPNIPGIFALLEHLNGLINGSDPQYPKKGKHIPVTENSPSALVFGHHNFPILEERTDAESWSLVSPGLQYPCEADRRLNEAFAERYDDFDFSITGPDDNLMGYFSYFSMDNSMAWFNQVKSVASIAAAFFYESGTLADCASSGVVANQLTVCIREPDERLPHPTCSADKRSLYEFGIKLETSARNLPPLAEATAAISQTHVRMFDGHPMYSGYGVVKVDDGPFWDIRPIWSSPVDKYSYLLIGKTIKGMMKTKLRA